VTRLRGGARLWILIGAALAHALLFVVVFRTVYKTNFSGTGLYYDVATRVLRGELPNRDFSFGYPPLSILFFVLPRICTSDFAGYYNAFQIEIGVADLIALVAIYVATREREEGPWPALGAYTVLFLAVGPIIPQQYDLLPAVLTLLAVLAFARSRERAGWIAIALGALTKLYPLLLAPVFLMPAFRERNWRRAIGAATVMALTALVVLTPMLIRAPTHAFGFLADQTFRGIQVESTYGGLLLALNRVGVIYAAATHAYGAWNVTGPLTPIATPLSVLVLIVSLAATYWFVYRRSVREPTSVESLAAACSLVVVVVLAASKVLSPQFMIWPIPLLALLARPGRLAIWSTFAVVGVLTYYIFPTRYDALLAGDGATIAVLVFRNILLLVVIVLLLRTQFPSPTRANAESHAAV
jgi:uncharacterized membrane protein